MKAVFFLVLLSITSVFATHTLQPLASGPGNVQLTEDFFDGSVTLCFAGTTGAFTGVVSNVGYIADGLFDGDSFRGTVQYGGVSTDYTPNTAEFVMLYDVNAPSQVITGTLNGDPWQWTIDEVLKGLRLSCSFAFTTATKTLPGHYEVRIPSEDGSEYTVFEAADFCVYDANNFPRRVKGSISTQHGHKWYVQGTLSADGSTLYANISRGDDLSGNKQKNFAIYHGISVFYLASEDDLAGVMTVTEGPRSGDQSALNLKRYLSTGNNPQYPSSSLKACEANSGLVDGQFTPKLYDYDFNTATLTRKQYLRDGLPQ